METKINAKFALLESKTKSVFTKSRKGNCRLIIFVYYLLS